MSGENQPIQLFPKMTVGLMGSAGGILEEPVRQLVRRLGSSIAKRGYVLITGACPGLPHDAVTGAKLENGVVIGISPALNFEEHVKKYNSPTRYYDAIIYTGSGLMGREIENIRSCDVVVFAGGHSGTLGEFAIAYDEGKVIGVLTGSGGITEHLGDIVAMVRKNTGASIFYDPDPDKLLDKLQETYRKQILPQHLKTMKNHNPDGKIEY
jgi:uncharacterized protein (TIGR00725 family)